MKKIIVFIISLFIISNKVSALYTFHLGDKIDDIYVYREKGEQTHIGKIFEILDESNEVVYCIDPFTIGISDEEYEIYFDTTHPFDISSDTINKINLIAHFGYGYENHTDKKWYLITQFLIWNELGLDVLYFSDSSGNRVDIYTDEINEINELIEEYNILPDFEINDIYDTNETYILEDKNNVLDKYTIHSSEIDYEKESNKLTINTKDVGVKLIQIVKHNRFRPTCLFYLQGSQSLIKPGFIKTIGIKLYIRVISGKIEILKRSKDDSVLAGATYGIYKDGILLSSKTTDQNGKLTFDNLKMGTYQIKEINAPTGYLIDDDITEITIDEHGTSYGLIRYNELIYGNLIINKYLSDTMELEDGAVFQIYDSDMKLVGEYETVDGKIDVKLKYGSYLVMQISGKDGYTITNKFNVFIEEPKEYVYDLLDDPIYEIMMLSVPNTGIKKDVRTKYLCLIYIGITITIYSIKKTTHE